MMKRLLALLGLILLTRPAEALVLTGMGIGTVSSAID
jgi:hypothetical protein